MPGAVGAGTRPATVASHRNKLAALRHRLTPIIPEVLEYWSRLELAHLGPHLARLPTLLMNQLTTKPVVCLYSRLQMGFRQDRIYTNCANSRGIFLQLLAALVLSSGIKLQELDNGAEFSPRFAHSSLLEVKCSNDNKVPETRLHVMQGYALLGGKPQWCVGVPSCFA